MTKRIRTAPYWCYRKFYVGPYIWLCLNERQFKAAMRWLKVPEKDWPEQFVSAAAYGTSHFFECPSRGARAVVVMLRDYASRPFVEVVGLLAHEAVHIFDDDMEQIGEKTPSKEFKAYSIQNITQGLLTEFLKAVGKPNLKVT